MLSRSRMVVLAALLVLATTACGQSGATEGTGETAGETTTGETTAASSTDTEASAGEALALEGETVASADLYQAALDEGMVSVYTAIPGGHEDLWAAFTEDTGIEVDGIRLPTGKLAQRIVSEVQAGQFPADVISMPDRTHWAQFVEDGYLQAVDIPSIDKIDPEYGDPDAPYYPLSLAPNAPAYNSELISGEELPSDWPDLLDPQFDGNLGFKPAAAGSGGWSLALFLHQEFGVDYLEKLAELDPLLESSASAVAESLARGDFSMAVNRPPTIKQLQQRGAPVDLIFFEGGTPMAVYYTALVSEETGSTHPNAGEVFVNWSLSKAGQNALAEIVGDYPVHDEANTPTVGGEELPALADINPWVASTDDWLNLRDEYVEQWGEIFGFTGG